jgi:polar amino acid transport system substrate-binding protein
MVIEALAAGKHVFVEKPLAINEGELQEVTEAFQTCQQLHSGKLAPILMVGFNRRFSPLAVKLKEAVGKSSLIMTYRVNAGPMPRDNWVQDPEIGGGRLVGEVCHFVDLMQFISDSDPVEVFARALGEPDKSVGDPDNICIQLRFSDGSLGTITYAANGDPKFPKERIEVFGGGRVGVIANWRRLEILSHGKRLSKRSFLTAPKGHSEELLSLVQGIKTGQSPISFRSLQLTAQTTFAIQRSLREREPVSVAIPTQIY